MFNSANLWQHIHIPWVVCDISSIFAFGTTSLVWPPVCHVCSLTVKWPSGRLRRTSPRTTPDTVKQGAFQTHKNIIYIYIYIRSFLNHDTHWRSMNINVNETEPLSNTYLKEKKHPASICQHLPASASILRPAPRAEPQRCCSLSRAHAFNTILSFLSGLKVPIQLVETGSIILGIDRIGIVFLVVNLRPNHLMSQILFCLLSCERTSIKK